MDFDIEIDDLFLPQACAKIEEDWDNQWLSQVCAEIEEETSTAHDL